MEFQAWPKTPRLSRESMIITEKIDGTNAAVIFEPTSPGINYFGDRLVADGEFVVGAQSRKRLITPESDNYGFARWVWDNADQLFSVLGEGLHFGEWWGEGIQRRYGLTEKRFSLFNTHRWGWLNQDAARVEHGIPDQLQVVPLLGTDQMSTETARIYLDDLRKSGSIAAPGFMNPEGICLYLPEAGKTYKMTFDGDMPKGMAALWLTPVRLRAPPTKPT